MSHSTFSQGCHLKKKNLTLSQITTDHQLAQFLGKDSVMWFLSRAHAVWSKTSSRRKGSKCTRAHIYAHMSTHIQRQEHGHMPYMQSAWTPRQHIHTPDIQMHVRDMLWLPTKIKENIGTTLFSFQALTAPLLTSTHPVYTSTHVLVRVFVNKESLELFLIISCQS